MKQRLLIDMDGVLADIYPQLIKFQFEDLGVTPQFENLNGKLEREAFLNHDKYIKTKGFFRNAPVIKGSVEALRQLNDTYELFIVSSATQFPTSLEEKLGWLNEHFPFISWKQVVFCGIKTIVDGDIMVDDHLKNLDFFKGKTILFSQPHNYGKENKKHIRVNNWTDVLSNLI